MHIAYYFMFFIEAKYSLFNNAWAYEVALNGFFAYPILAINFFPQMKLTELYGPKVSDRVFQRISVG